MRPPIIVAELRDNANAGERLRIALDERRGRHLLEIRVTTRLTEATGIWTPTSKGVSVNVALLPALREALEAADAQARAMGLLNG